ncbi:MAG: cytidylate kinase, partial [Vulcanimicrobiaceae bacterium]
LAPPLVWDYLAIVDPQTFVEPVRVAPPALVIGAVRAGSTRLLDNLAIGVPGEPDPILSPPRPRKTATLARRP